MTVGKTIILRGLSTDTKPTRYSTGTIFIEYDTGATFVYNSTTTLWVRSSPLLPNLKKFGTWTGQGNAAGFAGLWSAASGAVTGTGVGTVVRDSTGVRTRYDTGTTVNSLSWTRLNSTGFTERDLNPETHWKIKGSVVGSCRIFIGYTSATVVPASNTDYLNALSGVGFWADTSVDTNWHIMQNSGTGASDTTTIANVGALNTTTREIALRADNANSKFQYSWDNGAWTDINTKIPAASTGLGWIWYIENLTGVNEQIALFWGWTVQDG
jgi:hypothetical protein